MALDCIFTAPGYTGRFESVAPAPDAAGALAATSAAAAALATGAALAPVCLCDASFEEHPVRATSQSATAATRVADVDVDVEDENFEDETFTSDLHAFRRTKAG